MATADENIERAKLAERAERYEDMAEVFELHGPLCLSSIVGGSQRNIHQNYPVVDAFGAVLSQMAIGDVHVCMGIDNIYGMGKGCGRVTWLPPPCCL